MVFKKVLHVMIRMLELVLSLFQITSSPATIYHASETLEPKYFCLPYLLSSAGNQACTPCHSRSDTRFHYLSSCSHVYIVVWKHWSKFIEFCLCVWCLLFKGSCFYWDHWIFPFPTEYINSATFSILLQSILKSVSFFARPSSLKTSGFF